MNAFYQKWGARVLDLVLASTALLVFSPLILVSLFLVWLHDKRSPFYLSPRIGRNGQPFRMFKIRTMVVDANVKQVDSTGLNDPRITKVGSWIRRFKIDEMPQFLNVLKGEMTLVGPRPNVARETAIYTEVEKDLLTVKPGVTDLSSIVFFDLAHILESHDDANIAYNQLVRPWKSRLGLLYVKHKSLGLDLAVLTLTATSFVKRQKTLRLCHSLLAKRGAEEKLLQVCLRDAPLYPFPPPGSDTVVSSR